MCVAAEFGIRFGIKLEIKFATKLSGHRHRQLSTCTREQHAADRRACRAHECGGDHRRSFVWVHAATQYANPSSSAHEAKACAGLSPEAGVPITRTADTSTWAASFKTKLWPSFSPAGEAAVVAG
jgi:hypothetical protein